MQDAIRQGRGTLQFLPLRMLEHYLLIPEAIARLYNEIGQERSISTTAAEVEQWITAEYARHFTGDAPTQIYSEPWLTNIHEAHMLRDLFAEISDSRLQYRKTTQTPRLTVLAHESDPESTRPILQVVGTFIPGLTV